LQTRLPTAAVQVATSGGLPGSGVPLSSFGVQSPDPPGGALHHWSALQSASAWHPALGPHAPLVVSHTGPAGSPAQSASVEHLPH